MSILHGNGDIAARGIRLWEMGFRVEYNLSPTKTGRCVRTISRMESAAPLHIWQQYLLADLAPVKVEDNTMCQVITGAVEPIRNTIC